MESQEIFLRNNTGNRSKEAIVEGFVVRTNEFDHIRGILKESKTVDEIQNIIIVGQRGAGKTTLMHRLNYSILDDKILNDRYLPILFSEEQYNLSDLTNLWEAVAVGLEDNFYKENLASRIDRVIENEKDYEIKSFQLLEEFISSKGKVVILFIENLNFFLKKLSDFEKMRLKEVLTSSFPFRVFGSSASLNDGTIDFGGAYYDFFELVQLDGLTKIECEKLLIKIGQQYGEEDQIRDVINEFPGRVESLRRLTGGVPRTISYLFQIFLDNENGKAIKDLYLLIDTLTLLYKSELDQLSAQQQKVIDAIARKWDAISVKEIAKRTRLESKNISSILSYLEKNQLVEKVPTSTKNHLYRIKERFMNIWYLMRFGRKHDKENVVWLVRFFDAWCDESELTKRLRKHISNLKDGKYDANAAIDMGNTFLSCENIPDNLKDELVKTTNSILPDKILKNAKTKKNGGLAIIAKLIKEGKINQAAEQLENETDRNIDYYQLAISIYLKQSNREKLIDAAEKAWHLDDQNSSAAITMGLIYEFYLDDSDKAIQFYETSLSLPQPHPYAANRLGDLYKEKGEYELAISYHKQAISKNFKLSLKYLGRLYYEIGEPDKAIKYLKDAAKVKVEGANTALASVLNKLKKTQDAELALLEAIEAKENRANYTLGRFYLMKKSKNLKKAEKQFKLAIQTGDFEAYNQLARISIKRNQLDEAINLYEKGVDQGNSESAHQLGHLLNKKGEFQKSDEMFAKAIELGEDSVAGCWVQSIYNSGRIDKKLFAKELLEKHKPHKEGIGFSLLYAKILLWNGELSSSLEVLRSQLNRIFSDGDNALEDNKYSDRIISELVEFSLLLIARKDYEVLLDLFNSDDLDLKTILKPVYYLLMAELKTEFPTEYLKAGQELEETIKELNEEVEELRKMIV